MNNYQFYNGTYILVEKGTEDGHWVKYRDYINIVDKLREAEEHLRKQQSTPDGWCAVPQKLTAKMLGAMYIAYYDENGSGMIDAYYAALQQAAKLMEKEND